MGKDKTTGKSEIEYVRVIINSDGTLSKDEFVLYMSKSPGSRYSAYRIFDCGIV